MSTPKANKAPKMNVIEHKVLRPGVPHLLLYYAGLILFYNVLQLLLATWNIHRGVVQECVYNPRQSYVHLVYLLVSSWLSVHYVLEFVHKCTKVYAYSLLVLYTPMVLLLLEVLIISYYLAISMKPGGRHQPLNWEVVTLYALAVGRAIAYGHLVWLMDDLVVGKIECKDRSVAIKRTSL